LYAAFERKDLERVQNYQREAIERLSAALGFLSAVAEIAGPKPIMLTPQNDEEREMLTDFQRNLVSRYKQPVPVRSRGVV